MVYRSHADPLPTPGILCKLNFHAWEYAGVLWVEERTDDHPLQYVTENICKRCKASRTAITFPEWPG